MGRTSGPHLPNSEDWSRPERSSPSKKFTLTPSQSRKDQSRIDLSLTSSTSSPMRSCASCQSKSRPRPDKELDSRLLLPVEIDKVTLVSESRLPRKSKLPSRVLWSTPSATSSQSEEVIGDLRSVVSIPSHPRLRASVVLHASDSCQPQEELV